jgi:steroid delta-isomerase-like uncharacterized protein
MQMSEDLKALNKRFNEEVFNRKDERVFDELVAEDIVDHETFPGMPEGKEGVRTFLRMVWSAFPDLHATIEDEAAEGDRVWSRTRMRGTHQGVFMGISPTGKSIDIQSIDCVRVRDGKAVEHWGVTDMAGLMMQLGVLEGPAA